VGANGPTIRSMPSLDCLLPEPWILDPRTDSNASNKGHNLDNARSRHRPQVREGDLETLALPESIIRIPRKTRNNPEPRLEKYNSKQNEPSRAPRHSTNKFLLHPIQEKRPKPRKLILEGSLQDAPLHHGELMQRRGAPCKTSS
jgi:hypothetical protein